MVKGLCSRMIQNFQFYGGYQYLQYIHSLIMDLEFGLVENCMPQMMEKLSKMIKMSKVYPDTPNLNESMTGPYKAEFM